MRWILVRSIPVRWITVLSLLAAGCANPSPQLKPGTDEQLLFRGRDGMFELVDLEGTTRTVAPVATLGANESAVGAHSATVERGGGQSQVAVWRDGAIIAEAPGSERCTRPRLMPGGDMVAYLRSSSAAPTGRAKDLLIWNFADNSVRAIVRGEEIWSHSWSPDGKHIALAGPGWLEVRDVASGRDVRRWPISVGSARFLYREGADLIWSADGETLVLLLAARGGGTDDEESGEQSEEGAVLFVAQFPGLGLAIVELPGRDVRGPLRVDRMRADR